MPTASEAVSIASQQLEEAKERLFGKQHEELKETVSKLELEQPKSTELTKFYEGLHAALQTTPPGVVPIMEAPRKVIAHLLEGKMQGFDDVHYIIYKNVKVFEQGKLEEGLKKEGLTTEQALHGRKA